MFFHTLVKGQETEQLWGLQQWVRLLQGSMANLAACERWVKASGRGLWKAMCWGAGGTSIAVEFS